MPGDASPERLVPGSAAEFDAWSDDGEGQAFSPNGGAAADGVPGVTAGGNEFDAWSDSATEEEVPNGSHPAGEVPSQNPPVNGEEPKTPPPKVPRPPTAPPPAHLLAPPKTPPLPPPPPLNVVRPHEMLQVPIVLIPIPSMASMPMASTPSAPSVPAAQWSCFFSLQHGAVQMKLYATLLQGDANTANALVQAAGGRFKLSHRVPFSDLRKDASLAMLQLVPLNNEDRQARDTLEAYLLAKDRAGVLRVGNASASAAALYLVPPQKTQACLNVTIPAKSILATVQQGLKRKPQVTEGDSKDPKPSEPSEPKEAKEPKAEATEPKAPKGKETEPKEPQSAASGASEQAPKTPPEVVEILPDPELPEGEPVEVAKKASKRKRGQVEVLSSDDEAMSGKAAPAPAPAPAPEPPSIRARARPLPTRAPQVRNPYVDAMDPMEPMEPMEAMEAMEPMEPEPMEPVEPMEPTSPADHPVDPPPESSEPWRPPEPWPGLRARVDALVAFCRAEGLEE